MVALASAHAARGFNDQELGISLMAPAVPTNTFIRTSSLSALQVALSVRVRAYLVAQASDAAVGIAGGELEVISVGARDLLACASAEFL